ncbi:MAG: hypothetical protein AAGF60_10150 [Pseudomonadota bacterium]
MLVLAFVYLPLAVSLLAALCAMILRIGALVGDCPRARAAAQAASVTIATGFAAIGLGGIALVGAAIPFWAHMPITAVLAALGFIALCLGLGFSHAVATLRAVVMVPAPAPEG